ncbi:MAG: hypothetical protein ACI4WS_09720 [Oscillospiraceae bacterium]
MADHNSPAPDAARFPSASNGDSLDWKDPTPADITKKVVDNVKSGSIVLFHNDLENTTEALPQVLEQLKQKGFGFVTVSELIYHDNYRIDANGMQTPIVQSSADISAENIDEVMTQYSDRLHEAGFTDEQLELAAQAVKSGAEIPEEVYDALAQYVMAELPADGGLVTEEPPQTEDPETPAGNGSILPVK